MRPLPLASIAKALGVDSQGVDFLINGVCTDTRNLKVGNLFVALKGEIFDAHEYLQQAVEAGASVLVVEHANPEINTPQLVVPDTYAALASIGQLVRSSFSGPLIGVTGSSGKTTVKEMLRSILSFAGKTLATQGNFNNHIGVPLTLMELDDSYEFAVIEMGASGPGEIAYLASVAEPNVVLVNNVMPAHLEGFGNLDGVAMAKGEIYQNLGNHGKAIINEDQAYAESWSAGLCESQILRFSLEGGQADVFAADIELKNNACYQFVLHSPIGNCEIELKIPGRHSVANAVAAATCAFACGVGLEKIQAGLNVAEAAAGRLKCHKNKLGSTIIDDSYNANPGSVCAAMDLLAQYEGKKIFVLGDMGELGKNTAALHRKVGLHAASLNIDGLYSVGVHSEEASAQSDNGRHFKSKVDLAEALKKQLSSDMVILIKGSRSAKMETIVESLMCENELNNGQDLADNEVNASC